MPRWPDKWIVVPNWDKFQGRRERPRAPWIKLYVALLHKSEWRDLSLTDQGVLVTIWLYYAEEDGRLRLSDLIRWTLPEAVHQEDASEQAERARNVHRMCISRASARLNHAGFIAFSCDKPLPLSLYPITRARANGASDQNGSGPSPPCPYCEVGGGQHLADCPTLLQPSLLDELTRDL